MVRSAAVRGDSIVALDVDTLADPQLPELGLTA
jgi:hypothetical protein